MCSFIVSSSFLTTIVALIVPSYSHQRAEAQPYYVVASGWELRRGSRASPVRNEVCVYEEMHQRSEGGPTK